MKLRNQDIYKELHACPICESSNFSLFTQNPNNAGRDLIIALGGDYFDPKWSFCINCTHIFLNPSLSENVQNKLYGDDSLYRKNALSYLSEHEMMMEIDNTVNNLNYPHKTHFSTLKKILKFVDVKEINFLDFGAGWGSCKTAAEAHGLFYEGIEIDSWCLDQAKKLGRNVNSTFNDYENLDLLYSMQVFEHISNPKEVLESFIHKMKVGSYIFINVPTYEFNLTNNWGLGGVDGLNWTHFHSFSSKSLICLFELYGFEMERSWLGSGDINMLMRKTNNIKKRGKLGQNSLVRKKIEFMLHTNFLAYISLFFVVLPKKYLKKILKYFF